MDGYEEIRQIFESVVPSASRTPLNEGRWWWWISTKLSLEEEGKRRGRMGRKWLEFGGQ